MECVIEKEELLRCLYLVQGVVEKRSSLPILAHVLIESVEGTVSLGATDLEVGIRQQCKATVKTSGAVTIDARKLYEIIRELPPERVVLRSAGEGWIEVSSGRSRFRMASLDPKEFPAIAPSVSTLAQPEGKKPAASVSLPGETLREMIEKTLFAASPDETRLNLSGVYLEAQPSGKLRMVASDGHRLSIIERETAIADPSAWPPAILPRKGLIEARKLLEKGEGETILALQGTTASLKQETTELSMRLIEGEFPDYQQVVPKDRKHTLTFSREELLGALRRLLVLTTERARGIKLQVEKEKMVISVNTPDLGEGVEEIGVTHDGGNIIVGFNGRYLIEVLNVMEEGQPVNLYLKDEASPGLLQAQEDKDFSYIIMPMRIF
ncbi:MAG: DNA polymerase III subunit beta [Deltaproteobacteria bacterium]|nr:DNA polymerase III subunit beta [Deltaproteobacteria bacterium]